MITYIPFLPQTTQWLHTADYTELSYTESSKLSILFETNVQSGLSNFKTFWKTKVWSTMSVFAISTLSYMLLAYSMNSHTCIILLTTYMYGNIT